MQKPLPLPLPLPCRGVLRNPRTPLIHFVGVGRLNGGRTAIRKFLGALGGPLGNPGGPRGPQGAPGENYKNYLPLGPLGSPQTVEGPTVILAPMDPSHVSSVGGPMGAQNKAKLKIN